MLNWCLISVLMELFISTINRGCQVRMPSFSAGKTIISSYHIHFRYYCYMFRPVLVITLYYLFQNQSCVIPCIATLLYADFLAPSIGVLHSPSAALFAWFSHFLWLRRDMRPAIFWDFTRRRIL